MKKNIYLKMALGITLLVMIGSNICNSFKKETLSDLVLSNVEALADSRENGDKTWTAPRTIACHYCRSFCRGWCFGLLRYWIVCHLSEKIVIL